MPADGIGIINNCTSFISELRSVDRPQPFISDINKELPSENLSSLHSLYTRTSMA
jgi:hypothetical protein